MRESYKSDLSALRQRAEEELARQKSLANEQEKEEHTTFCKSLDVHHKKIHELEISRILLEMQNKELEEALEKAAIATALYECSPAGYFTLKDDGTILETNISGTLMLGVESDNLINTNFTEFISEDLIPDFLDFLQRTIQTGERQHCEIKLSLIDKPSVYTYFEGFVCPKNQNCLVTAIDITEQKKKEEIIQTSESRLKRAEIVSKTGNWELHLDTKQIFISDGTCKIYGVQKSEFPLGEIINASLPEYRSLVDQKLQQLIQENKDYDVEFKINTADTGEIKTIHSIATFDADKNIVFGVIQDITEQKAMEQRLHESEQYYRSMVETSPDAIVIADIMGNVQFASRKVYELFNLSSDFPVIGSSLASWIAPEMREFALNRFKGIILGTIQSEPFEYKLLKSDGSYVWAETHGSCIRDAQGQTQGMFLICRNVTERRETEEAMRESEFFIKQSQWAALIGSYRLNIETGKWKSSQVLDQIFGTDDSSEKNLVDWLNLIHPEDREMMDRYLREEVIMKQKSFNKDYRIIRKTDGQTRWLHGLGELEINDDGNVVSMIGTIQDITERKLAEEERRDAEERFRLVFENVFDGIAIYEEHEDPFKRRLIECNSQYAIMAGRSREELLAMGYVHHLQVSQESNNNSNRLASLAVKQAYRGSSSWIRPDGKENVIEYIGVPVTWRGKSYSIGIDRDITERIQIEADLIAAKEKAEESDRLKSAFLANMSHEIRTPLNSIIGFSELMSEPDFDLDQLHQFASIIQDSGNNLLSIISDIMDISKIEAGLVQVRKHEFSVSRLIDNLYREYSFQATKKGIMLIIDPSIPREDIFIISDEIKLRQIIINLLGNAIKFTEKGFVELSMNMDDKFLQFQVRDTGIGIPPKYQKQIFERFHQVESSLSRRYGGNGLGLAISKSLSELLGGSLWLESMHGKGSSFYFKIPIAN